MHSLRTTVIEHTNALGVHHDWLIEDPRLDAPDHPEARLWTARVIPPPTQWPRLGRFDLEVIPPHRRLYLTYQGQVSGDRGRVRRAATGICLPTLWSRARIVIALEMRIGVRQIEMRRLGDQRWLATVDA